MESKMDARLLQEQWQQLILEYRRKSRLNEQLFKDTFSATYLLLRDCARDSKVEKEYLPLIISAYTFSVTDREQADAQSNAAFVLTERLIHRCLLDRDVTGIPQGASVYILEERKEIYLDFNDAAAALDALAAVMHKRELME